MKNRLYKSLECLAQISSAILQVVGLKNRISEVPGDFLDGLPPTAQALGKLVLEALAGTIEFSLEAIQKVSNSPAGSSQDKTAGSNLQFEVVAASQEIVF